MVRKYHNKPVAPWWRTTQQSRDTWGRQTKLSNQLSLPHQDDCETSIGHKVTHKTKNNYRIPQWEQQLTMNQQQQNHRLRTDNSLMGGGGGGGGVNEFYWCQIFALDSVVVKAQKYVKLALRLPNNYCNVSSKRNNLIKLTHYDEPKNRAHNSQIVRAKENLKLSHGGLSHKQASCTNPVQYCY